MVFPQLESADGSVEADYVLFDVSNNSLSWQSPAYVGRKAFEIVMKDPGRWRLMIARDGYYLFKRDEKSTLHVG